MEEWDKQPLSTLDVIIILEVVTAIIVVIAFGLVAFIGFL